VEAELVHGHRDVADLNARFFAWDCHYADDDLTLLAQSLSVNVHGNVTWLGAREALAILEG